MDSRLRGNDLLWIPACAGTTYCGFPPARERLIGVVRGPSGVAHGAIWRGSRGHPLLVRVLLVRVLFAACFSRDEIAQGNALIFTHISEHARLEIPMDLRDLRAFSPPRPAALRRLLI